MVRNGIEWRALPADFPPWESCVRVLSAVERPWPAAALVHRLRRRLRAWQGRTAEPSACIVDSQIVKCADTVGKATSGYHGGKKITGRGRHLAVDTEGWLLALVVTAASVSDRPAPSSWSSGCWTRRHAEDHVGRQRLRRRAAGGLGQGRRRHHLGGRPALPARTASRSSAAAGSWSGHSGG